MSDARRRRFTTTLAADMPAGPDGQPAHKAGAEVSVVHLVTMPGVGSVATMVPRPSALLRDAAQVHLERARRHRERLPNLVRRGEWVQPGYEMQFANEAILFDFFQESMAAVLLLFASVDAWVNEQLPVALEFIGPDGNKSDRSQVEGRFGIEKRMTAVLPQVTGRESPATAHAREWDDLLQLKDLRDAVAHVHRDETFMEPGANPETSVFSRLLAGDLQGCANAIDALTAD